MNRHVHADKIIAKAENMDLVIITKGSGSEWYTLDAAGFIPAWFEAWDYFLCHEEHTEACLHWFNGGEVEVFHDNRWLKVSLSYVEWTPDSFFMNSKASIRIKPKKEKRWIGYCSNTNQTFLHPQVSKSAAEDYAARNYDYKMAGWQFIEIEVEV